MTRPNSLDMGRPKTPSDCASSSVTTAAFSPSPKTSLSSSRKSPRNPSNTYWVQEQQRRIFLHHLGQWSLCNDSSPYFHGKISLFPDSQVAAEIGLGKSVACILTDGTFTDARKKIVVRLFPPQEDTTSCKYRTRQQERLDSMEPFGAELNFSEWQRVGKVGMRQDDEQHKPTQYSRGSTSGCYKLVIRCGAGWVSAREYLSKLYFTHVEAQKVCPRIYMKTADESYKNRSKLLGPPPSAKDSVTVQPLFHPFRRLPPELQEMILKTAAGYTRTYNLCYDPNLVHKSRRKEPSPISLSTMFLISKELNEHLVPYIFHSTDFNFGLTGFTNFLWQSGPENRLEIRRLTFHFGKLALLHCIRWLAPDSVFDLLEPPVVTSPRALQYFWRCQIQDLARELNLFILNVNLKGIPFEDIPMVVCILKRAFGSIQHMRFVEIDKYGVGQTVELSDETRRMVDKEDWRAMCMGYLQRHKAHHYFFKWNLMNLTTEEYEGLMDGDKDFFTSCT